jgi:putative component of membrane protein insertase Oxa1/YidC/SpoIIIJ protein YidD
MTFLQKFMNPISKKTFQPEKLSIRIYLFLREIKHQVFFSVFGYSASCHQKPSCSQYTVEQMKKNGTIVGLLKGMYRAVRCYHH